MRRSGDATATAAKQQKNATATAAKRRVLEEDAHVDRLPT